MICQIQIPLSMYGITSYENMMFLIAEIWDNNIFPLATSKANDTLLTNKDCRYLNVS